MSAPAAIPLPDGLLAGIDRAAEIPIGVQLAWALRSCIRDGRFSPAQRLPGLRELADAVGVNVNTVRAVYQRLEREGLIDSRQGSGTFVSQNVSTRSPASTIAADAAREALAAGADPREVAAALYVAPSPSDRATDPATATTAAVAAAGILSEGGSPEEDAEAAAAVARRRALRAQIAGLERAIAEMETEHPGVAPAATSIGRHGGPALLSAQELEQVRSALVRRLSAVQAAIDERATAAATGTATAAKAKPATAQASDAESSPGHGESASDRPAGKRPTKPRATPRPAPAGT